VLEASFRTAAQRKSAQALARDHKLPFYFVECHAPAEVYSARLAERAKSSSVSDGRPEIMAAFAQSFEPVTELPTSEHLSLDTTRDLASCLEDLRRQIGFGQALAKTTRH
jgi:predicted kinase